MQSPPSRYPSRLLGLVSLLGVLTLAVCDAQVNVLDWRDPGWTNLATGGPSEFLSNSSSNGSGWEATHRLENVGGSGIDATLRISHQPNGWNIENRPALGPYFASPNGTDGDILRAWNSNSNIPSGELPYYTLEFSQPVTISKFGLEGMRNDDAWQIQAYDWAGNLVAPNWPDANVAVETTAGDPLQNEPINLLRGALTEAESNGRYDGTSKAFITWNKNNVFQRAAAVVDYNGVIAKKIIFTMVEVDTSTGISVGTPSDTSIYLAGGFEFEELGGGGDPDPGIVNPLPHCYLVSDDGLRLTAYNHDTQIETDLGDVGVEDIEAITFDPASGTLYGARGDSLYLINTQTGAASVLGEWSPSSMPTPMGALDSMSFDDVDGLARDVASNIWYASARVDDGVEAGSPDLLFQFNPLTGNYIPGAFPGGHDYVRIEKPSAGLHLIDDLSFDPFTRKLYGIANGNESFSDETTIVEIDPATGNTIDLGNVVYNPAGSGTQNLADVEGLTITLDRRVLITTGKGGNFPETLFELHGLGGGANVVAEKLADLGFGGLYTDYEAITCAVYVNPAEVGGTVFSDVDSDGLFGGGDSGIGSVDIQLQDVITGNVLSSVATDPQGSYYFGGLPFGSYNVVVADSNFSGAGPLKGRTPTGDPEGDNDNVGTFIAPPEPVSGFGKAVAFDGIDDHAHTKATTDDFEANPGPFTMTVWANPDLPFQTGGIFAGSRGGDLASHILSQSLDRFAFQFENVADLLFSQTRATPGFWYHLAATYDGTNLKLYVNGILEAEKITAQIPTDIDKLWFGRARTLTGNIHYDGLIDAASFWETALSQNQIQILAQLGVTGTEPQLNAFWDWEVGADAGDGWDHKRQRFNLELQGGAVSYYESNEAGSNGVEVKASQPWGQSFRHFSGEGSYELKSIQLGMWRDPDATQQNLTISVREFWNGPVLASTVLDSNLLPTTFAWIDLSLDSMLTLIDGTTYVIKLESSNDGGKVYWHANDSNVFSDGTLIDKDGNPDNGKDALFRLIRETGDGATRVVYSPLTALDFGYSAGSKDKDFTAWQQTFSTILAGEDAPTDNHDGDIYSNLLEYALCLHPGTGVSGPGGFLAEGTATNVDAVFWRRAGGHDDVTYQLEGRSELPIVDTETWNILLTIPGKGNPPSGVTVTDLGNGIEQVRIADVGNYSPLSPSAGFVRMTVELNDGNNVTASSYTQVYGWKETTFNQGGTETYSNALTKVEQVSGSVELVSGSHTITVTTAAGAHLLENVLDLSSKSYYLEVTGGDLEGHRFDITGAANDTLTLASDSNATEGPPYNTVVTTSSIPNSIQGDQFLVREHYTLNDYFPPSSMTATATLANTSDQVYLYNSSGWTVFWLREDPNGDHWTSTTDLNFADTGDTVIAPGEGLFVQTAANLTLFAVGPVRKHAFQRPLAAGYNLVASGFPKDQSISERAMTPLTFDGDPNPEFADQVCVFDTSIGGYHCYFLLETSQSNSHQDNPGPIILSPRWVHTEDTFLSPADFDTSIFQADKANFLFRANAAKSDYFMPLSWCVGLIGE